MTSVLLHKQIPTPVSSGDEDMRQFLSEIRQYPRLTPEEELELAQLCAQGDEIAIRRMVNSNLRLVVSVAREYAGRGVPLLDLIQEGSIGLLAAARKFDHTLQFRFSTYATKWIRQGVTKCLLNHSGMIRVPAHTAEQMRKVEQAKSQLLHRGSETPTTAQIAEISGLPEDKVIRLQNLMPEVCSLDIPVGEASEDALQQLLQDVQAPQPQEELVRRELEQLLGRLLDMLEPRQSRILRLHFGMEDGTCHSLEEIAGLLNISKERARQIEKQAMEKLQKMGANLGLEDFLE